MMSTSVNLGDGREHGLVFLTELSVDVQAACRLIGGLAGLLSSDELLAAERYRRSEDRLDYAASHALFRLLAAWSLGRGPREAAGIAVMRYCTVCGSDVHGKPHVDGISLSLSRSRGSVMAAAGTAPHIAVGADIEQIQATAFLGFDEYVLAPDEQFEALFSERSPATGLWAAKEAVLKAAGLGLTVDPSRVRLRVPAPASPTPFAATADCPQLPTVHGLKVAAVEAPSGFVAAIAARDGLPSRRLSLPEIMSAQF
jgi:4'-phosphopantetheinyl transferase